MGGKLQYERFIWFHKRLKAGKYPNARTLSEKFEISSRTAQRDIEFMRDRLSAPLEYNPKRRGFCYTSDAYELPSQWHGQDNVMAFALALRLASTIPDTEIKQQLLGFIQKILNINDNEKTVNLKELSDKISVKNIEYSRVNEIFFHDIVNALFETQPISITYYSPHSKKASERTILPLHLIQYMGSWHVVAFCALRNDLRNFALSRIKSVDETGEEINPRLNITSIKDYTRKNFGIMQGGKTQKVCLQFTPSVAAWIQEQIWHPEQKTTLKRDGSLQLSFPAADFKELVKRILSHGADVKVISPRSLQRAVMDEITRMNSIY